MVAAGAPAAEPPLGDADIAAIEQALARVPAPLEPLDASMLDGFLCGLLVQPQALPESRWLPFVTDVDGRPLPQGFDASRLHALVRRRLRELDAAIEARHWFDPWVFELAGEAEPADDAADADQAGHADDGDDAHDTRALAATAVYPWVAGFVTALQSFPALLEKDAAALQPALVLLYRHLEPDDLEDADELLEAIAELEPPADLGVAVEELVRATLLLADIGRPRVAARPPKPRRRR